MSCNPPPLPLSQQILAYLLQALGFREAGFAQIGVGKSTLTNARRGQLINTWDDLIGGLLKILGVADNTYRRRQVATLLRRWDAAVSSLTLHGDLSIPERLDLGTRLLTPHIGVRLGILAALLSVRTRTDLGRWEWLFRPLSPGLFGQVMDAVILGFRPEWKTREQQAAALDGIVDERTLERWRSGSIKGPNAEKIEKLARCIDPRAEAILRIARACSILHSDLVGGKRGKEGWLGKDRLEQWMAAVAHVAKGVAHCFNPEFVRVLLELRGDNLTSSAGTHERDLLALCVPISADLTNEMLAQRLRELAQAADQSEEVRRGVTIMALLPELLAPRWKLMLIASACYQVSQLRLFDFKTMDLLKVIQCDWNFRIGLHGIVNGETTRIVNDGDIQRFVPLGERTRHATRALLEAETTYFQTEELISRRDEFVAAVAEEFGAKHVTSLDQALAEFDSANGITQFLADQHVAALPQAWAESQRALALRQARLYAEDGDLKSSLQLLATAMQQRGTLTPGERIDAAVTFSELAHCTTDSVIITNVALYESCIDAGQEQPEWVAAIFHLLDQQETLARFGLNFLHVDDPDEALVHDLALAGLQLRLGALKARLGHDGVDALASCWTQRFEEHLAQRPTDGRVWAMLVHSGVLAGRAKPTLRRWRRQTRHYGGSNYLRHLKARQALVGRDLEAIATDYNRANCPDCGGTGIQLDPPEALAADELVLCTCVAIPDHWR